MTKKLLIIIIVFVLILAGLAYWYFFFNGPGSQVITDPGTTNSTGFSPFGRPGVVSSSTLPVQTNNPVSTSTTEVKMARLRMLSSTPIGGYAASTTASTTLVRWIDRGRGNIYEILESSTQANLLSNTTLPRVYESVWNKNMTAFIGSIFMDIESNPNVVYAQLHPQATSSVASSSPVRSTDSNLAPFNLKGRDLPEGVLQYAVSPKGDRVFLFIKEDNMGVGYVANFGGESMTKVFDTPLTQVNVEWPEENTLSLSTKGAKGVDGFLYLINIKTGAWKKVAGPLSGLSAKVSHDAKYAIVSSATVSEGVYTSIVDIENNTSKSAVIRTIADKCVWGISSKATVYCAVPSEISKSSYPDSWYKGSVSFVDKIWKINVSSDEVKLVSAIIDESDTTIDAYRLGIDQKDNYLFFVNKNDLSFWSLDLRTSSN